VTKYNDSNTSDKTVKFLFKKHFTSDLRVKL